MQIEHWPLNKIRPYPNNPRVLKSAATKVADSIREFGWRQPIVVDTEGTIIIGHARLAAAQLLKLESAPVHVADGLTPDRVRALRIADNKTSEFAEWDDAKLHDELSAILETLDLSVTGFSQSELDALDQQVESTLAALEAPQPQQQAAPVEPYTDEPTDDASEPDPEPQPLEPEPDADDVQMLPFNVMLPSDTRELLYDAISRAKQQHGLNTTHEALLVIAREYVDA